jgi:25S rRNA (uracil2843-N3)-methyltransferase
MSYGLGETSTCKLDERATRRTVAKIKLSKKKNNGTCVSNVCALIWTLTWSSEKEKLRRIFKQFSAMGQFDRKKESQPKHGKPSSSGAYKGPPPMARGIPEDRKGRGYTAKKKPRPQAAPAAAPEPPKLEHILPVDLEKRTLEVFRTTFPASNDFEALKPVLQEIRDALNCRDFDKAFGSENYLEAYTIRWSPSRTLGYAQLLAWICTQRAGDLCIQQLGGSTDRQNPAKVVCFGGGASEFMALSGLLRYIRPSDAAGKPQTTDEEVSSGLDALSISPPDASSPLIQMSFLDNADWTSVLSKLDQGLKTPPVLSKYASAAVRAANAPFLLPGIVENTFTRSDILSLNTEDLRATIGTAPALVTLMSTLNDLYTISMPRTTAFLRRLKDATPKGSLLLVVDSPGACLEVAAANAKEGDEKREYPMNLLLDYALLPKEQKQDDSDEEQPERAWEKVVNEPSMVYKLDDALKFPVSLENMRFQVHLFKRI